jgi:diguanylate cyclase (GGDEF)-like protein
VLIGTLTSWALAGVVGVAAAAALILWHLGRLMPERVDRSLSVAWGLVALGPVVASLSALGRVRSTGGAMVVVGILLLGTGLARVGPESMERRSRAIALTAAFLATAGMLLPEFASRGVYGLALLVTVIWLATKMNVEVPRVAFNLGVALLAAAGIGLMAGAIRPSIEISTDAVIAALLFGGVVAMAVASVVGQASSEISALRRKLADLQDEHGHLLRLAESDPLTGCPTRQALRAWFQRWEGGEPVSVVLIDVDDLKRINARHGHGAGDEALRLVADVLKQSIRPGDLVVRWGGDEFVAVLRGAGHDAAKRRFTGLIRVLEEAAAEFPYPDPLHVNWGVSSCAAASDISLALAQADERMYAMKRSRQLDAGGEAD